MNTGVGLNFSGLWENIINTLPKCNSRHRINTTEGFGIMYPGLRFFK